MFGLPTWHKLKKRYDVFINIINKHLEDGRKGSHHFNLDTEYNRPLYVVKMVKELHNNMHNKDKVDINDLFYLDTYNSGHVDYAYKFALHIAELEKGTTLKQIIRPWEK